MNSSNDLLREFELAGSAGNNSGFSVVVAFDYYDGPERGVALYPSGTGVRFRSLGDSKSRLFRAFELSAIDGDWRREVETLKLADGVEDAAKVWVPARESDALQRFDNAVSSALATGLYVGVGSPYLTWMYMLALDKDQLQSLRQLDGAPGAFNLVHRLVKHRRRLSHLEGRS